MILALDIGNTTVRAGVFSEDELVRKLFITSSRTTATYRELADDLLRNLPELERISLCLVSSVRPALTPLMNQAVEYLGGAKWPETFFCDYEQLQPVLRCRYDNPASVGMDRWMNVLQMQHLQKFPAAVIDCGSATTASVIDGEGYFTGGFIAPGPRAMKKGQAAVLTHLPAPRFEAESRLIAGSSQEALSAGLTHGYAAMVQGLLQQLETTLLRSYSARPSIYLTGGNLNALGELLSEGLDSLNSRVTTDHEFTLRGLNRAAALKQAGSW